MAESLPLTSMLPIPAFMVEGHIANMREPQSRHTALGIPESAPPTLSTINVAIPGTAPISTQRNCFIIIGLDLPRWRIMHIYPVLLLWGQTQCFYPVNKSTERTTAPSKAPINYHHRAPESKMAYIA